MLSADALMIKYNAMPSCDKELVTSLVIFLEKGGLSRQGTFLGIMGTMSLRTPEFVKPYHLMTERERFAYMRSLWDEIRAFKKDEYY